MDVAVFSSCWVEYAILHCVRSSKNVILHYERTLANMPLWRIMVYHLAGGTCPFLAWCRAQEPAVRGEFYSALDTLRKERDWLDMESFKPLTRNHVGLGEIRFKLERREHQNRIVRRFRPIGIWPPVVEHEFILLLGCEKGRNGILIPPDTFDLALDYKRRFQNGEGISYDLF